MVETMVDASSIFIWHQERGGEERRGEGRGEERRGEEERGAR